MAALNALMSQASAEINTLQNQGQTVYNQQMTESQAATVAGNQDIQQANVANQNATTETQKASNEAQVMATTGASGNIYQQNLTSQESTFGYNAKTLDQTIQEQNQAVGQESTALNRLEHVMGGNSGLSAAGVQAKAQSITSQANQLETHLGNLIQTQEGEATTAATYASSESQYIFAGEQQAEQSYTAAAASYIATAANYQQAAQSEYNSASNYSTEASITINEFSAAMANVGNIALAASENIEKQAQASFATSEGNYQKSQAAYANQEKTYNAQQESYNKSLQPVYEQDIGLGLSSSKAAQLSGYTL
jgi:hypothetical protein